MNKIKFLRAIIIVLVVLILGTIVFFTGKGNSNLVGYDAGVDIIDPNTIVLNDSGVKVSFSEVIISKPTETRKLVVFEQDGTVSYKIEDRTFDFLDWEPTKKYQTVRYTGTGSFVVNLDQLTKRNLIDDKKNKVLTIKIPHPSLDKIEIDPAKVEIGNVSSGFLAIGKIKLTVSDYNYIEKELRDRLKEKFDNTSNGQQADDLAKKAVYEIYAPIVKAVNSDYELVIEFM